MAAKKDTTEKTQVEETKVDTTEAAKPKAERKVRTEEERIADMQAEIDRLKAKAEAKSNKEINGLKDKLKVKRDRIAKLKVEEAEIVEAIRGIDPEFEVASEATADGTENTEE